MAASPEPLDRLRHAPLELLGRIVESSNATFLMAVGEVEVDEIGPTDGDVGPLVALGAEVQVDGGADRGPDVVDTGVEQWILFDDDWDDGSAGDDGEREVDDADEWEVDDTDEADEEVDEDGAAGGRPQDESSLPAGLKAVYKPLRGERPLWDFPEGLFRREVAAYELSVALGWDLIPATIERDDVLGVGSLQRFVEADFSRHYFVLRNEGIHDDQLRRMCVFDLLANNTDRKGGHVLIDAEDHIWGIDNGLCFSTEARLRTVIWDFAGEAIGDDLMDAIVTLIERGLPHTVCAHLRDEEADQLLRRARILRSARQLPHDPTGRAFPWPLV